MSYSPNSLKGISRSLWSGEVLRVSKGLLRGMLDVLTMAHMRVFRNRGTIWGVPRMRVLALRGILGLPLF